MLVFKLEALIDTDEFRKTGLRVVDASNDRLIVAFADDPELASFRERINALTSGVPEGKKSEPYAQFFDAIREIHPFSSQDRVTPELASAIREHGNDILRIDVECWHPGTADLAQEWLSEVKTGIEAAEGKVSDTMLNNSAGLVLLRVYIHASQIMSVAELDSIARMDVLPQPALPMPQLYSLSVDELPEVQAPDINSAIVGLVDSGVASGHPLIGAAVLASDAIGTGIDEDQDQHGHRTMVASRLLHRNLENAIAKGQPLRPICRIVSARVLDANNEFPVRALWESDLQKAIAWCADHDARIINLSIGDSRSPFSPPRQMSAAAVVDTLARELSLVIVVAAGNSRPADYLDGISETSIRDYPKALLNDETTGLLDPGTSLLSLTVGGLTDAAAAGAYSSQESPLRQPMGKPGWPSPITRKGPGPGKAIKPEVSEQAGTLGIEKGNLVSKDAELEVVGANAEAGRLLNWSIGTSYAVPLVSRVAAAVVAKFPKFSAELIRSLVLVSTERLPFADSLEGTKSGTLEAERALLGYGRPSIERATESTSHRVILVAEDSIPINGVHIYEIPIPSSFMSKGGKRGLDIALSYSPRARVRRLDYMASLMEFHVVKGLSLNAVSEVFAKVAQDESADDQEGAVASISELGSNQVKLEPATQTRSRGANQLGRKVFHQRLKESTDEPMFLIVKNTNRWDDDKMKQSYALAVTLWRDENQPELHAELQAILEAEIEIPIEIEIEQ